LKLPMCELSLLAWLSCADAYTWLSIVLINCLTGRI